jgi:hypothetical protein
MADCRYMGLSLLATTSFISLWIAAMYDVYRTDHRFVRQGPKWCWLIFVATLPILGALGWMMFGRPRFLVKRDPIARQVVVGVEDTPEWAQFAASLSVDRANRLD